MKDQLIMTEKNFPSMSAFVSNLFKRDKGFLPPQKTIEMYSQEVVKSALNGLPSNPITRQPSNPSPEVTNG